MAEKTDLDRAIEVVERIVIEAAEEYVDGLGIRNVDASISRLLKAVRALQATRRPKDYAPGELPPGTRFRFVPHPGEAGTGICVLRRHATAGYFWSMDGDSELYCFGLGERLIPIEDQDQP